MNVSFPRIWRLFPPITLSRFRQPSNVESPNILQSSPNSTEYRFVQFPNEKGPSKIVPDLITMAKGMGGGLPVAAVTGRADVMDSIHAGGLGGTYGGNPIALAGALGAIETIEKDNLVEAAKHIESIMIPRLKNMAKQHQLIGDVRGRGAMVAIEIVKPGTTTPDPETTTKIVKSCHAEGVLVLTAGTYGNVLRFLPPLVISDELLNEGLDVLEKAIVSAS